MLWPSAGLQIEVTDSLAEFINNGEMCLSCFTLVDLKPVQSVAFSALWTDCVIVGRVNVNAVSIGLMLSTTSTA